MNRIKNIAFDLDDTLLDTSQLLVVPAATKAFEYLLSQGLNLNMFQCLSYRARWSSQISHHDIFYNLTVEQNVANASVLATTASEIFYNPEVPNKLPLMKGAKEALELLSKNYVLHIVTIGKPEAQQKKINALGITDYFKEIHLIDLFKKEKKQSAFQKILTEENLSPEQLLSVGNRRSHEIREAKQLGAQTCWLKYGEHSNEIAQFPEDNPDFTILTMQDLITTCQL